jgi:cysteinyl-tRNA synthetase
MLTFYNTLTRKKQVFKPLKDKVVKMYTCGPTVYDFVHLGNLRTYIWEDVLRRTLKYNGYKIRQVKNITDVEDKIIKRAQKERKNIYQITKLFTKKFFKDVKKLNIEKAEFYPKATEYIKEMIALIKALMKKGFAYKGNDGSVYFNISRFKDYGKLSHLKKRQIKIGARIAADEYNKTEAQDFVLWKSKKPKEPFWKSPFGEGRPGWHIECSAMSMKNLGKTIDIHTGGVDLIFPHHENEIAQSEAATGKKFVKHWIHGEHLLIDGKKMAKSLANFFTLRDLEDKGFNPLAYRYLVLTTHYRSKLNFTWKSLKAGQNALDNLYSILRTSDVSNSGIRKSLQKGTSEWTSDVQRYENRFLAAVNDDLNTPKAVAVLWGLVSDKNISGLAKKQLILKFDKVLGLGLDKIRPPRSLKIPQKIRDLAARREKLRASQQFIQADALRKKIKSLGYYIEDTAAGPLVLRK